LSDDLAALDTAQTFQGWLTNVGWVHAVSRIKGKGDLYEMDVLLDVNTDLYPMEVSTSFAVAWLRPE